MRLSRIVPKSIATKLLALNAVALCAVGAVIVSNLALSRQTGRMAMDLLDKDVPRAICNAELGRGLNKVCSDVNLVLNTFSVQKETLSGESARIVSDLRGAISSCGETAGLHEALQGLDEAVRGVLTQCAAVNEAIVVAERTEAALDDLMATLESTVTDIIITRKLEGRRYELYSFEQLSASIPDLQKTLLATRMLRIDYQQIHLGKVSVVTDQEKQMLDLLASLESGVTTASTAGEEIAPVGKKMIEAIDRYRTEIGTLHQRMRELRARAAGLSDKRSALMSVMTRVDHEVSRAAEDMKERFTADTDRADGTLLALSLAVAGVLAVVGIFGIRIARPIHELTISASQIASGNLDRPIVTTGTGETGVLGRSLARMRDAIKEKIDDLARKNAELIQEIHEREKAAEEKAKLESQLIQAQKMQAVGQLAGGVAHDFNNLLQVILGHGDLALEIAGADNPTRPDLESIMAAAKRAAALVRQLLAFSRRQVLELAYLDLNEVISNVLKMIKRVIGEHIALEVVAGRDLGAVRADWGQVEQVLMNLCVNARDAMPDGGAIALRTDNVRIDSEFCRTHSWAEPGDYVLLSVADTGCGMSEETLASAFEPFFTTKDIGQGTGLGLSTVYGIVKQHDGLIHARSKPGEGSTFDIYLPRVEREIGESEDKIDESAVPGGTETILMAEDDENVRNLGRLILEKAGYTVLTAADGEEALRVFDSHADAIGLVLLDVMMPKLNGKAVLDRIRPRRPDMRVVFSSGYSMENIRGGFLLDDGVELVQKPYRCDALLRTVRKALDS